MRRLLAAQITKLLPVQVVYFHESNPGRVVYTPHNRGVVSRLQVRNYRRLRWVSWSMPARLNSGDLAGCEDATDYRMLPVIVRGNQSSCAIVQFQGGISQCNWEYYMEAHRAQGLWREQSLSWRPFLER